ncbi:proteinase inhibitor I1, Kazal [Dactylonectria estremocensis]|uniref:Proteinase inhibitor I1, Kazal n=1 Tax=Dactylonectria estremocensis TaxID=1079267 RepID=A0A9P9EUV0_9HYPO|nr:proteinase inhibitor I1, Kazal [Dactylonectria estremocensis]
MMLVLAVASVALASVATAAAAAEPNQPYPPISCGVASQACPFDTYCIPDDSASRGNDIGSCAFRNSYQRCGGHTAHPSPCDAPKAVCVDDPRTPESCGMACDRPGICLELPDLPVCACHGDCPDGQWCYLWRKDGCKDDCSKVCL